MIGTEIIVIDDDPVSILVSSFLLKKSLVTDNEVTITSFNYPKEGLMHIKHKMTNDKAAGPQIKVLLDINMPEIDGWKFLKQLNVYDPERNIKVIMHSSSLDDRDISSAYADPRVECYISKPMEMSKAEQVLDCFTKKVS